MSLKKLTLQSAIEQSVWCPLPIQNILLNSTSTAYNNIGMVQFYESMTEKLWFRHQDKIKGFSSSFFAKSTESIDDEKK